MPAKRRPWTRGEILTVIRAANDGMTREEAAEEVSRSVGSVKGLVSRSVPSVGKIKFRHVHNINHVLRADVLNSVKDGFTTARAIASVLGRKEDSVRCVLRRMAREGLVRLIGYGKARVVKLTKKWDPSSREKAVSNLNTVFPLREGDEVRLATDHPLSNGKLGRVVSIHDWGAVLETNFATRSYRAGWHEMEPVDKTEFVNPEANGNGYHKAHGVARNGTIMVKGRGSVQPTVTGDPCPNCQGVNLVRTGSCVTCLDCGTNEGCG